MNVVCVDLGVYNDSLCFPHAHANKQNEQNGRTAAGNRFAGAEIMFETCATKACGHEVCECLDGIRLFDPPAH